MNEKNKLSAKFISTEFRKQQQTVEREERYKKAIKDTSRITTVLSTKTKAMGSLPNLNELCQEKTQRRLTVERERDAARERAHQLGFISRDYKNNNRTKDQLPTLFQVWLLH